MTATGNRCANIGVSFIPARTSNREAAMKFTLGMLCGFALMLGSAYVHDIGVVKVGPAQPFVNWDTVFGMLR